MASPPNRPQSRVELIEIALTADPTKVLREMKRFSNGFKARTEEAEKAVAKLDKGMRKFTTLAGGAWDKRHSIRKMKDDYVALQRTIQRTEAFLAAKKKQAAAAPAGSAE